MKMTEAQLKVKVLMDLRSLPGCWAEKIQQVSIHGTPDILACVNGTFVALELKRTASAKISHMQQYKLEKILEAGGVARVVHPENWADVLNEIRRY